MGETANRAEFGAIGGIEEAGRGGSDTPRRRRRSPFGSRNTPAPGSGAESGAAEEESATGPEIVVDASEVNPVADGKKRERKPRAARAITQAAARESAADTLNLLNDAARWLVGPHAVMADEERESIARPLTRLYQRHSAVAESVGRVADPLSLVVALGFWIVRTYYLAAQQRAALAAQQRADGAHAPDIQTARDAPAPPPPPGPAANDRITLDSIERLTRISG